MSGRGRGGGSSNTMRSVANALGIARYDMAKMMSQQKNEPPQLYPKVQHDPVPLEMTTDMLYVSRLKVELDQRMRDSQFFIEAEKDDEIKRYLDKYSNIKREKLSIDMSHMPNELIWRRASSKSKESLAKRRKVANDDSMIKEKLKKLEEKEAQNKDDDDDDEKADNDKDSGSEKSAAEEEENPLSDDDNQEEDNDYISAYFDNGEGYGDGGSDDNLDADDI
ncbi:DNA-directed RNA polymerase III subunit [Caenorhabditis elegans]|uniref:DNA-directed RNA polymerase III subunit n=1 Tax=Caenorhabditis elegans TaxID=6239 RepID=Q9N3T3_CAEEL|nr:DNA-directed RNA polymerase III subunit [Caenorhabditis elegans]CCD72554.2 DNA-directed RNA polymerase III subunit [Caenorhabditis elegans]